jgi:hypothetical protein
MKALIDPNSTVERISAWTNPTTDSDGFTHYTSTLEEITNGQIICEIKDTEFQVADPLFWVDCNSSVTAEDYYYDGSDSTIKLINNEPFPSS